jgi:hypothetical protein
LFFYLTLPYNRYLLLHYHQKVDISTKINLPAETVWAEVQTASLLMHIAWPLMRFVPVGKEPFDAFKAGGSYLVKLRLFGVLPFGTQWIVTSVHEPENGKWPKRLRDDGHSAMIRKWDHWITIAPNPDGGTDYRDEVEISAGVLTPFVWTFAQLFYRHRQRRWRGLARTLRARRLIAQEMAAFQKSRTAGDIASAWHALERAHVVSRLFLGLHIANHRAMLGFAVAQRDWREVRGQILRLALAPIGTITGRIPLGNTGRSKLSVFQTLAIPDDLRHGNEDELP